MNIKKSNKEIYQQLISMNFKDYYDLLNHIGKTYPTTTVLASSFSYEDQIIAHTLSNINNKIKVFTIDTGRIPHETFEVMQKTMEQYQTNFDVLYPNTLELKKYVERKGPNAFYNSLANRIECCNVRKTNPLKKYLSTKTIWICGLRSEQSVTRKNIKLVEWDSKFELIKINPLYDWDNKKVMKYIEEHNIPYNVLYDKGYTSIGCSPCTRAIRDGEDVRAGRWWWENPDHKECGLHK